MFLIIAIKRIDNYNYNKERNNKMKNNKMLVCRDCNSSDVSIKVWVNINETINNKPITNYEDSEEYAYCNSCELNKNH